MAIITPERFIKSMRKSAYLYDVLLRDVSQEQARAARDGADGWNVIEVMCHLRDFEAIFFERARMLVEQDNPDIIPVDHLALVTENRYTEQNLKDALQTFLARRREHLAWLESRAESDWTRTGRHPDHGEIRLIELPLQTATHDIDHLEQVTRILNEAS